MQTAPQQTTLYGMIDQVRLRYCRLLALRVAVQPITNQVTISAKRVDFGATYLYDNIALGAIS